MKLDKKWVKVTRSIGSWKRATTVPFLYSPSLGEKADLLRVSIYRYPFFPCSLSHRETAYLQNLRLIASPFTIQSSPPFIVGHSRTHQSPACTRSGNSFELQLCGIAHKQSIRTAMYGTSTSIYFLLRLHMICISLVDLLHVSLLY